MTNVFQTPEKVGRKRLLHEAGVETLRKEGYTVARVEGLGKSSVYRITKNGESKLVSIKTTQDRWITFVPKSDGTGWITLDDVDVVLAVSVDRTEEPREALVHWLPADEMRERFDRLAKALRKAKHVMPEGRGVWIPLYDREGPGKPVGYTGGGAGLDHEAIARVPLNGRRSAPSAQPGQLADRAPAGDNGDMRGLLAETKRTLSLRLGVPESSIKITIEA